VVTGEEVRHQVIPAAIIQKLPEPIYIIHTADRGASYLKLFIHLFHSPESMSEQAEILLHIRIFPKNGEIWFIPYFDGPAHCLIPAIAFY